MVQRKGHGAPGHVVLYRFSREHPDERRVKHKCAISVLSPGNAMKPEFGTKMFGEDASSPFDDSLRAKKVKGGG